jgi:lipopolysaccharide transport system ATP-binding protein
MSRPIIEVENLSKLYRLGELGATSLREEIASKWRKWRGHERAADKKEFWALRDVSFSVQPGEVVGIIGRNGAGKSTLLKILSRITEPTIGRAVLRGRVASLLEVGTGFHPDLSGRDNIYLNGAILGMTRAEITKKFDEIVAFAEVEQFIDTPVKRYSSGMYVRLAFAVAAHLEPEILIVDEVLAVGDASFQRKCLGKMKSVGAQGRTILFVSHNTGALLALCNRGMFLRTGAVERIGPMNEVVQGYLGEATAEGHGDYDVREHAVRDAKFRKIVRRIVLKGADGKPTSKVSPDEHVTIELHCTAEHRLTHPRVAIAIEDQEGRRLMTMASYFETPGLPPLAASGMIRCFCPSLALAPGRYLLSASIGTAADGLIDALNGVVWFDVQWHNNYPSGEAYEAVFGPVLKRSQWTLHAENP